MPGRQRVDGHRGACGKWCCREMLTGATVEISNSRELRNYSSVINTEILDFADHAEKQRRVTH